MNGMTDIVVAMLPNVKLFYVIFDCSMPRCAVKMQCLNLFFDVMHGEIHSRTLISAWWHSFRLRCAKVLVAILCRHLEILEILQKKLWQIKQLYLKLTQKIKVSPSHIHSLTVLLCFAAEAFEQLQFPFSTLGNQWVGTRYFSIRRTCKKNGMNIFTMKTALNVAVGVNNIQKTSALCSALMIDTF